LHGSRFSLLCLIFILTKARQTTGNENAPMPLARDESVFHGWWEPCRSRLVEATQEESVFGEEAKAALRACSSPRMFINTAINMNNERASG
jgi:hypothetical protein